MKAEIVALPEALMRSEERLPPERRVHLLCLLDHMFDEDINVNGVLYHVTEDGWLPDVPESAAKKLLLNPDCWNECFDAPQTPRQLTDGAQMLSDGAQKTTRIGDGLTDAEEAELRQLYQNYGRIRDPDWHHYGGQTQSADADAAYARQRELLSRRSPDAPRLSQYDAVKTRRRGRPAKGENE